MMLPPVAALLADTLLVRPVDVPVPWYSVASGVLSIVVTLLLLGIAVALLGMARALKGAEKNLGGRMQGLADELIPLARNLNQIATQLSEVTTAARGDLQKLSGTVGAVDSAVRDALDAGEARLHQFGTLLDAVQDEAQATVASATGIMRGVRTGAGAMVSNLFRRDPAASRPTPDRRRRASGTGAEDSMSPRDEADVYARLAALEAAFAAEEDDDEAITAAEHRSMARGAFDAFADRHAPGWDNADALDEDEDEDAADDDDDDDIIRLAADARDAVDRQDDDDDDDDDFDDDDEEEFDDDDDDDEDDSDDGEDDDEDEDEDEGDDDLDDPDGVIPLTRPDDGGRGVPRTGGPRIRRRGRA